MEQIKKHLCTVNYAIEKKILIDRPLTKIEKQELIKENQDANCSYLSLLKEMLTYSHCNMRMLLKGWGGVKVIEIN